MHSTTVRRRGRCSGRPSNGGTKDDAPQAHAVQETPVCGAHVPTQAAHARKNLQQEGLERGSGPLSFVCWVAAHPPGAGKAHCGRCGRGGSHSKRFVCGWSVQAPRRGGGPLRRVLARAHASVSRVLARVRHTNDRGLSRAGKEAPNRPSRGLGVPPPPSLLVKPNPIKASVCSQGSLAAAARRVPPPRCGRREAGARADESHGGATLAATRRLTHTGALTAPHPGCPGAPTPQHMRCGPPPPGHTRLRTPLPLLPPVRPPPSLCLIICLRCPPGAGQQRS